MTMKLILEIEEKKKAEEEEEEGKDEEEEEEDTKNGKSDSEPEVSFYYMFATIYWYLLCPPQNCGLALRFALLRMSVRM